MLQLRTTLQESSAFVAKMFRFFCILEKCKSSGPFSVFPNEDAVCLRMGGAGYVSGKDDLFVRNVHERIVLMHFRVSDKHQPFHLTQQLLEVYALVIAAHRVVPPLVGGIACDDGMRAELVHRLVGF